MVLHLSRKNFSIWNVGGASDELVVKRREFADDVVVVRSRVRVKVMVKEGKGKALDLNFFY